MIAYCTDANYANYGYYAYYALCTLCKLCILCKLCNMHIMHYAHYALCTLCIMHIMHYAHYASCTLCIMHIMHYFLFSTSYRSVLYLSISGTLSSEKFLKPWHDPPIHNTPNILTILEPSPILSRSYVYWLNIIFNRTGHVMKNTILSPTWLKTPIWLPNARYKYQLPSHLFNCKLILYFLFFLN